MLRYGVLFVVVVVVAVAATVVVLFKLHFVG